MPFNLPVVGLTEVCTLKIVLNSNYNHIAHHCHYGKVNKPYMNCYKCFRKSLLEKVIKGNPLEYSYLDRLFKIKDVQNVMKTPYMAFGNVLSYITTNYNGNHIQMKLLKQKTRGDILNCDWMHKWYPHAEEFIIPKYQMDIIEKNSKICWYDE
ncbi:hypothetical protein BKP37_17805 [Anaerobacillus alkalilacustris]|uniref:Uncharacterized protein n=1 Tax=Anaerobacillus alkalilacustris TaxID=393763 RepID=A0A1S2LDF0_9BACI|nr:DUF6395 domain-containing protein [Anaerobacillus alkalilacustris]OIJ10396.1 hypothetical protein BKP37_17805 [Anaerobacillus alkalilacustris]